MTVKDIIKNNPYRVMGVFSNDSMAALASNNCKMKAFAAIGKTTSYPHDMTLVIGSAPERDLNILSTSMAAVSSPMDRLKHGMFWFMNITDTDAKALKALAESGNPLESRRIWEEGDENISSLQNQLICCLLKDSRSYSKAIQTAWTLYSRHGHEFIRSVSCGLDVIDPCNLMLTFLTQILRNAVGEIENWDKAIMRLGNSNIELCWAEAKADDSIQKLQDALNLAKTTEIHSAQDNYDIAIRLMRYAGPHLKIMKTLLDKYPSLLSRYATIADTVCEEILNREIAYYNQFTWGKEEVMQIKIMEKFCYRYAATVRIKERCKKNINITLGRSKYSPLFPNGEPDKLFLESERRKRNACLSAIMEGLKESKKKART